MTLELYLENEETYQVGRQGRVRRKLVQEAEARRCTKLNWEEPGSRARGTVGLAERRVSRVGH